MDQTKALGLATFRKYLLNRFRQSVFDDIIKLMPPRHGVLLNNPPLITTMLSWETYLHAFDAAIRATHQNRASFLKDWGYYQAEAELGSIYRFFIRAANPGFVISMASRVWRQYHSTGELTITERTSHSVNGQLSGFQSRVGDDTIRYILAGFFRKTIEMSGGRHVRVNDTTGTSRGAANFLFRTSWE